MLHILAKKRMRKINRIVVDNDFKHAHSIHSIALEELQKTLINSNTQYSELINSMNTNINNKGY